MSREKRVARRIPQRRRRLRPARHSIARQSAAVLALGLGLAVGTPAQARIVYQQVNQTISDNGLTFLNYQGSGDLFYLWHGHYSNAFYAGVSGTGNYSYVQANNRHFYATLLAKGSPIPISNPNWYYYGYLGVVYNGTPYGNFVGQTGYVGLEFDPGDGNHYAWAQISMPADGSSVTLIDYAYETEVDKPIKAGNKGAVPVPSLLLLLGTGAVGMLAYRRQKQA